MGDDAKLTCRTIILQKKHQKLLLWPFRVFTVTFPDGIQDQERNIIKTQGLIYILSEYLFTHAAIQFHWSVTSYEMEQEETPVELSWTDPNTSSH